MTRAHINLTRIGTVLFVLLVIGIAIVVFGGVAVVGKQVWESREVFQTVTSTGRCINETDVFNPIMPGWGGFPVGSAVTIKSNENDFLITAQTHISDIAMLCVYSRAGWNSRCIHTFREAELYREYTTQAISDARIFVIHHTTVFSWSYDSMTAGQSIKLPHPAGLGMCGITADGSFLAVACIRYERILTYEATNMSEVHRTHMLNHGTNVYPEVAMEAASGIVVASLCLKTECAVFTTNFRQNSTTLFTLSTFKPRPDNMYIAVDGGAVYVTKRGIWPSSEDEGFDVWRYTFMARGWEPERLAMVQPYHCKRIDVRNGVLMLTTGHGVILFQQETLSWHPVDYIDGTGAAMNGTGVMTGPVYKYGTCDAYDRGVHFKSIDV